MWEVELPLRRPLVSSQHEFVVRRSTIIRVVNGTLDGWGEAATYPGQTRDDPDEAWQLVSTEARRVLGADDPVLIEGSAASAAMDQALTALQAAAAEQSLASYLGGDGEPVLPSLVVPRAPTSDTIGLVTAAVERGYRHVKIKVAPGDAPTVKAVRAEFPELGIAVDCNGAFSRAFGDELEALDGLELSYIEQPLPGAFLRGHAELQQRLETPICLDESVRRLGDVVTIATAGAARAITIKPGRFGPTLTQRALMLAARHGLEAKVGGLVETGVGKHTLVALATLPGVSLPNDLAESDHFFERDLVTPPWTLDASGLMAPRTELVIDDVHLRRTALRHHRFRR